MIKLLVILYVVWLAVFSVLALFPGRVGNPISWEYDLDDAPLWPLNALLLVLLLIIRGLSWVVDLATNFADRKEGN